MRKTKPPETARRLKESVPLIDCQGVHNWGMELRVLHKRKLPDGTTVVVLDPSLESGTIRCQVCQGVWLTD